MKPVQHGFTLIELLVVIAIIGVLTSIALPVVRDYQARSKVIAGFSEISGGKTLLDMRLNDGADVISAADINLLTRSANCHTTIDYDLASKQATISCKLINADPVIAEHLVVLRRDIAGSWTCLTDVEDKFRPKICLSM